MKSFILLIILSALSMAFVVHNQDMTARIERLEQQIGLVIQLQIQSHQP